MIDETANQDYLVIDKLATGYGEARVLQELSLSLREGESLALLGRNGTGKTTLVNSIIGVTDYFSGDIRLGGHSIIHLKPEQRAHSGIGWVPQERNIFKSLTVEENLTAIARPGKWDVERIWQLFPRLKERRANLDSRLSGGEQQMLAIARALVINPKLLLLDEPTEGLAPIIVEELLKTLQFLFREEGMTGILVEQHAHKILGMTDQAIILERGAVVYRGRSENLRRDSESLGQYLGVAARQAANS